MPKSKRNKTVDLSKTKKHGLEGKKELYKKIQSNVENYTHVFVFAVNDMRNTKMKNVREQWKHSRFCIGKNKVMAMALGRTPEEEYRHNLHKIGQMLVGERGLLFTNQSVDEVTNFFQSYSEGDYARSGNVATEDVILPEGPLAQFPHNLESYLRQLGLPTTLKKGVIHLVQEYVVCREGDRLSPETARVLKLLGYEMAEFRIKMLSVWSQDGSFQNLQSESCDPESKENAASPQKSFMREDFELAKDCLLLGDDDHEMEVAEFDSEGESKTSNHIEKDAGSKSVAEDPEEEIKELEAVNIQSPEGKKSSAKAEIESNDDCVEISWDPKEKPEPKQTKGKKSKSAKTEIESNDDCVEVKENSEDGDVVEISSNHEEKQEPEKAKQHSKKGNAKSACKEKQTGETLENTNSKETEDVEIEVEEIQEPDSTIKKSGIKSVNKQTAKKTEKQTSDENIDKDAVLKLTEEKLESAEKPKKFSPKMTRARKAVVEGISCDHEGKQESEKAKQSSKKGNSKSADKEKQTGETLENTYSKETEDIEMEVEEIQEPESKKAKSDSTVKKTDRKTVNKQAAKKTEKQTSDENIDKDAVLKLTAGKLESAEKPKKFSPKMTRARAAASNKKIKTPEPIEITRSARKRKM